MTKREVLERLNDGDQIHVCVDVTRTKRHYKGEPWPVPGSSVSASVVCLIGGYMQDERLSHRQVEALIRDGLVVKHPTASADVPMHVGLKSQGLCLIGKGWAGREGLV